MLTMLRDGHIRLLPIHVANKIAAGEVVERPASVVKELIENAIDAGATRIDLIVTAGGRKLVELRDNGCGMNRDDALLSIERQATSKIRDVDDIERIDTLGFRGEALPSIASVSRFILKTRRVGVDVGTELVVIGGNLQEVRDAGVPEGTTIEVRDLFFNVPARRKFLRAYQTEQAHIRSVFTLHALAHPEIGMSFTSDGRELTRLPAGATLEERIRDVFGVDFCAGLRPVDQTVGSIRIHGFVSLPHQTRNDRSEQYVFINGRPATAPVISYALREAYPPLEENRKPIVLLFLELPPDQVDVNVHPTKREVRFHRPAEIRDAMIGAISAIIGTRSRFESRIPLPMEQTVPDLSTAASIHASPPASPSAASPAITSGLKASFPYPGASLPEIGDRQGGETDAVATTQRHALESARSAPIGSGLTLFPEAENHSPWKWVRVLGQLKGGYVLLETDEGFVTLDPRAARERVLYEQLLANHAQEMNYSQRLLLPETVQLVPADAARLRKHLPVLNAMGFVVDEFGEDRFVVESLPQVLKDVSCRELLGNIAQDLEHAGIRRGSEKWREELIAKAACRAAIGLHPSLPLDAIGQLVVDLATSRMPYTCPRGKPTMIFSSYRELDRKFGK